MKYAQNMARCIGVYSVVTVAAAFSSQDGERLCFLETPGSTGGSFIQVGPLHVPVSASAAGDHDKVELSLRLRYLCALELAVRRTSTEYGVRSTWEPNLRC